jgi:hypothetical protein
MPPRPRSQLYRLARSLRTVEAIASGLPQRIARQAQNVGRGRLLARAGSVWR